MSQLRVFGDPANVRSKLRRVIKRGQAILDELEGGRQRAKPDADSEGDSLSRNTAVFQGQRAMRYWRESISNLMSLHLPSLKDQFNQPPPKPQRGLSTLDFVDSYDEYIRNTLKELEEILETVVNQPTT